MSSLNTMESVQQEISTPALVAPLPAGVARLKREFVLSTEERVAEAEAKRLKTADSNENSQQRGGKKRRRGQNKARGVPWRGDGSVALCPSLADIPVGEPFPPSCPRPNCTLNHDVASFLANKPTDIAAECPMYRAFGRCPRGAACRFGGEHLSPDGHNLINADLWKDQSTKQNYLDKDLQFKLRKFQYDFKYSETVLDEVRKEIETEKETAVKNLTTKDTKSEEADLGSTSIPCDKKLANDSQVPVSKLLGPVSDEDYIKTRKQEKITISWKDKLYLSPLTTVGNLPFRRVCKLVGADITCGEMAMASSLLQGAPQEWALVRRHESENLFGAQICGSNPMSMARCAQLLQEKANVDFVDINMGCPIDLVYQQGGGSGLLRRRPCLQLMVRTLSRVLSVPLTFKTRTGVSSDRSVAHEIMPNLAKWGVSLVTLHGRSREQRYTKHADWSYIDRCARLADPVPLFGNGDILSFEDYNLRRQDTAVQGVMIGRGALIKPWIFTEIKEQRHWDISSGERLNLLKDFTKFGLEHWGSDTKGVETTRRFMLEWLSFLHRYVPVGLLEVPPQRINERPPAYRGRDDLETLMASAYSQDWVKISEMLLGPVPDGFNFLPKHKANAWQ